jgi:autotransporter-associated beta strand protein
LVGGDFGWAVEIGLIGPGDSHRVASDSDGNVYVAGGFFGTHDFDPGPASVVLTSSSDDVFLAKFTAGGQLQWLKQFGGSGDDRVHAICVDPEGNVTLTGQFYGNTDFDPGMGTAVLAGESSYASVYVVQLSSMGGFRWATAFDGPGDDKSTAVAVDGSGNLLVAGSFASTCDFDSGPGTSVLDVTTGNKGNNFVVSLAVNGDFRWVRQYKATVRSLAFDSTGYSLIAGSFYSQMAVDPINSANRLVSGNSGSAAFVLKLTPAGDFSWARHFGGLSGSYGGMASGLGLAVDSQHNILLGGYFKASVGFDSGVSAAAISSRGNTDAFVMKWRPDGSLLWVKDFGASGYDRVSQVAVLAGDRVSVVGEFEFTVDFDLGPSVQERTSAGRENSYVLGLTADGAFDWVRQFGGTNATAFTESIATRQGQDVLLAGRFVNTILALPAGSTAILKPRDASTSINGATSGGDRASASGYWGGFAMLVKAPDSATTASAPMNPSVTPGDRSVQLGWSVPASDGGAAINDYLVQYSSNAGLTWTTFNDGVSASTSAAVTGLTNGASYIFRVAAKNSVGQGTYSVPTTEVIPTATKQSGDFLYEIDNGTATLTRYLGGAVSLEVPTTLNGIPVKKIGEYAFSYCTTLVNVSLPSGLIGIGYRAFEECSRLQSLLIPDSVIELGLGAFLGCDSLTGINTGTANPAFTSIQGVLFDKAATTVVAFPGGKQGAYTVPAGVTRINSEAFRACERVSTVTLPTGLTTIGAGAFTDCSGLASVTIPGSVTSMGDWVFVGCTSLAGVKIEGRVPRLGHEVFANCTSLATITIPASVESIGNRAFSGCASLVGAWFEGTPPSLGSYVFDGSPVTIYYESNAPGWGETFGGRPTVATPAATVPTVPDGVVVAAGNAQMLVEWRVPSSDGGSLITDYLVQYSSTAGSSWTTFIDGISTTTSATVAGLVNGTRYIFRVAAVNSVGVGAWSVGSATVTPVVPVSFDINAGQTVSDTTLRSGPVQVLKRGAGSLVLTKANSHSGGTVVESGQLVVRNSAALGTGQLAVRSGAIAKIELAGFELSVGSLAIDEGGRIDLGINRVGIPSDGYSLGTIMNLLQRGYAANWVGAGGIGTSAARSIVGGTVGYYVDAGGSLTFGFAASGDTNLDDVVDILDLSAMLASGKFDSGESASWSEGDFNYDQVLDILDISDFLSTSLFNAGTYSPSQPSQAQPQSVSSSLSAVDSALLALVAEPTTSGSTPAKKRRFAAM